MKRTLSLLLSVTMLLRSLASMNLTAASAEAESQADHH